MCQREDKSGGQEVHVQRGSRGKTRDDREAHRRHQGREVHVELSKTFAKIEAKAKGGCLTPGDEAAVETTVDAFVADLADDFFCSSTCPIGTRQNPDCSCTCSDKCPNGAKQNPDCSCTCLNTCPDGATQNPDCSCTCENTCPNGALQHPDCSCCSNACPNGVTQNPDCSCACPNTCLNGGTLNPDCGCTCLAGYDSINGGCFRISNTGPGDDCLGPSCGYWNSSFDGTLNYLCAFEDLTLPTCTDSSGCPLGSACQLTVTQCFTQCTAP